MPDISKITLPSGNTYDIKDATAREMISGGVSFIIAWNQDNFEQTTTPTATQLSAVPSNVTVYYNNGSSSAVGTMAPSGAQAGAFYLIYSKTQAGDYDVYEEYVPITNTQGEKEWEKIGDTQLDLTDVVTGVTLNKQTASVIGADNGAFTVTQPTITTAEDSSTGVTFVRGGTTKHLTAKATSGAVTPTTTNIKATASGAAVGADGTASAVTGYPDATTDTFVKSVSAETGKNLDTTSITPVNGTETVSKVTKTASKLVTTSITPTNGTETVSKVSSTASKLVTGTVTGITANSNVTASNISSNTSVTANKSTWTFKIGSGSDSETLIIGGGNGSDVTATNTAYSSVTASKVTSDSAKTFATGAVASTGTGSDIVTSVTATDKTVAKAGTATTVATGSVASNGAGSDIVTAVTVSDKTVAKAGTATTVATGTASATGTGTSIVTGVTVGSSASAVTRLGTPSTATVLTGVKVTAQPTVALATGATAGTGVISVATGISSVTQPTITLYDTASSGGVTFVSALDTSKKMKATASGGAISINSSYVVDVLQSMTSLTVTKGNQ